jgi:hypothetical protein
LEHEQILGHAPLPGESAHFETRSEERGTPLELGPDIEPGWAGHRDQEVLTVDLFVEGLPTANVVRWSVLQALAT